MFTRREMLCSGIAAATLTGSRVPAHAGTQSKRYRLGDDDIVFRIYDFGHGRTFFAPHYSERTCVEAARAVLPKHGGRIIQLVHKGGRNITFRYHGKRYTFDPNRIFTNFGIEKTLHRYGSYSKDAHILVWDFAQAILYQLAKHRGAIIALHNNTKGAYSLTSYEPHGSEASAVVKLHKNPKADPDDFFFTTDAKIYRWVAVQGFNVALQTPSRIPDDGSLSVYCGLRGISYVNIEAELDHLAMQKRMIEAVA